MVNKGFSMLCPVRFGTTHTPTKQLPSTQPDKLDTSSGQWPLEDPRGRQALSIVLQTTPSIAHDAYQGFITAPKGSDEAVQAAQTLDLFLNHDASPNQYCKDGKTPLTKAIETNSPWFFQRLLKTPGVNTERINRDGSLAIEMALFKGDLLSFKALIKNIDIPSQRLLGCAAICGEPEMLTILLDKAPETVSPPAREGLLKLSNSQKNLCHYFKQPENHSKKTERLWNIISSPRAAHKGEVQKFSKLVALLKAGADVNAVGQRNASPLMASARANKINEVKLLQMASANPNLVDDFGETALFKAVELNHLMVIDSLIQAGANIDTVDRAFGRTVLALAASAGHTEAAQKLIAAAANLNHESLLTGYTPLALAILNQHPEMVRVLTQAGADINHYNKSFETPLEIAVRVDDLDMVKLLIEAGVQLDLLGSTDETPLQLAKKRGHFEIEQALIDAGAKPNGASYVQRAKRYWQRVKRNENAEQQGIAMGTILVLMLYSIGIERLKESFIQTVDAIPDIFGNDIGNEVRADRRI